MTHAHDIQPIDDYIEHENNQNSANGHWAWGMGYIQHPLRTMDPFRIMWKTVDEHVFSQ